MWWRPVALLTALMAFPAAAVETLRIAMGPARESVEVTAELLSMGPDREDVPFRPLGLSRAVIRRERGQLELNGAPVQGLAVRLRAGAAAGGPGQATLKANGLEVRGDVVVRLRPDGQLELINVLPLEDYLAAVLGSEMPFRFPMEALKAQAVAARTYALHKKLGALDQPYHLGSSVLHQVYGGANREDVRTRMAVEATRGEVLTYGLAPIEAYFHASCGGRTESGSAALNRDLPYLQPVECPCGDSAASHWTLSVPKSELESVFHDSRSFSVAARSSTGRARKVQVGERSVDAVQFRQRLGYDRVKSLAFDIEAVGNAWILTGHGYGHGAGLCQWGAKAYADQGWDYLKILEHYYPRTELQRLY